MSHQDNLESQRDGLRREMFVYLVDLRDRCDALIAAKYPLEVFNHSQALKSLAGQIAGTAERYRRLS